MKDTGKQNPGYSNLKNQLIEEEKLTADGEFYRFGEDIVFNSPSAAAAVVLDRNANGRKEWKIKGEDRTYADWQAGNAVPSE